MPTLNVSHGEFGGVQGWPLTEFSTALALIAGYLVLALGGPIIMSAFKPIDSYAVRFVYNIGQVSHSPR